MQVVSYYTDSDLRHGRLATPSNAIRQPVDTSGRANIVFRLPEVSLSSAPGTISSEPSTQPFGNTSLFAGQDQGSLAFSPGWQTADGQLPPLTQGWGDFEREVYSNDMSHTTVSEVYTSAQHTADRTNMNTYPGRPSLEPYLTWPPSNNVGFSGNLLHMDEIQAPLVVGFHEQLPPLRSHERIDGFFDGARQVDGGRDPNIFKPDTPWFSSHPHETLLRPLPQMDHEFNLQATRSESVIDSLGLLLPHTVDSHKGESEFFRSPWGNQSIVDPNLLQYPVSHIFRIAGKTSHQQYRDASFF